MKIVLIIALIYFSSTFSLFGQVTFTPFLQARSNSITYFFPYKYLVIDGSLGIDMNDRFKIGIATGYNFNLGLENPPITNKYKWEYNTYSVFASGYLGKGKTFQPGISAELGGGFNFKNLGSQITFGPRALQTEYFYTDADILGFYNGIKFFYALKGLLEINPSDRITFGIEVGFKQVVLNVAQTNENNSFNQYGFLFGLNTTLNLERLKLGNKEKKPN